MNDEQRKMLEEIYDLVLQCPVLPDGFEPRILANIDAILAPPRVITDAKELVEGRHYFLRAADTKKQRGWLFVYQSGLFCGDSVIAATHLGSHWEALPVTLPQWPEAK